MPEPDQNPLLRDDRGADATFSDDGTYRYRLSRTWNPSLTTVAFLMLNPSTADATKLDPTCRRCKNYAEDWDYGSLVVGNLFALRATNPDELYDHPDPVGPENDSYLERICDEADLVVAAWGAHGDLHGRAREVAGMLDVDLYALDTTKHGHPNHPLYLPGELEPEPFAYDEDGDSDA